MENTDSALEQFRRQWKEEVNARARDSKKQKPRDHDADSAGPSQHSNIPKQVEPMPQARPVAGVQECKGARSSWDRNSDLQAPELTTKLERWTLGSADDDEFFSTTSKEPESALEHYERAVEEESQGDLGNSLSHYRKAYRLDARVDQSYKNKYFPPEPKLPDPDTTKASVTVPSTAHHSPKDLTKLASMPALVASFADIPIHGASPFIAGDRTPPCPISRVPYEILFGILLSTAILDPASFARLATVCKRLAYHVLTENQIWKQIALGSEFGLASQQYDCEIDTQSGQATDHALNKAYKRVEDTLSFKDPSSQDWREVFHSYPRIRYTGVYISTVNYTRAGAASVTQATWNTPVHIVTYYRYLRFFRDGTLISLLSTNQPIEVVHHLTRENMALVGVSREHDPLNVTSSATTINGLPAQTVPPSAHQLMKHALRGRWRLCNPSTARSYTIPASVPADAGKKSDLYIETEGVRPRYLYTMKLALGSSGRSKQGVKNNKLQWKSFWSYNLLTHDWTPFQLKNDRAFFFSRVRSYGLGY